MLSRLYSKFKKFIKNNYIYMLIILTVVVVFVIPVPYYIDAPGGLINLNEKIFVKDKKNSKGSFNLTYVSEMKGNVFTFLTSIFDKNWDAIPNSENENSNGGALRNKLLLDNSLNNAYYVANSYLNRNIKVKNTSIYVVYTDSDSDTDLSIGDIILEVDGREISSLEDYSSVVNSKSVGDKISIKVKNSEKEKYAVVKENNKKNSTLIYLLKNNEYDMSDVTFKFKDNESGSSGGLMMALSIYNQLTDFDLTNGLKIAGTGTISEDGSVGEISGIKYKIVGAGENDADIFLVPKENYIEAKEVKKINGYKMQLVSVETFSDAIKFLTEYKKQ